MTITQDTHLYDDKMKENTLKKHLTQICDGF